MPTKWHWLAALLVAGGLWVSVAAPAAPGDDKKETKKTDDEDAPNPVIEAATTAYKTAEFGRANKAPEALVAAAVMLRSLKTAEAKMVPIDEQPTDENGKPVTEKALARQSFSDQADALFDEAAVMALTLKIDNLDAFIAAAKKRDTRAVIGGARTVRRKLGPEKTEVFRFKFENERPAEIAVHASHPVEFVVEHENVHNVWFNGKVTQHDARGTPRGKAKEQATLVVKIHNPEKKAAEFELLVR
jgi:hypothetical protein